jgi:hypothetical protein
MNKSIRLRLLLPSLFLSFTARAKAAGFKQ